MSKERTDGKEIKSHEMTRANLLNVGLKPISLSLSLFFSISLSRSLSPSLLVSVSLPHSALKKLDLAPAPAPAPAPATPLSQDEVVSRRTCGDGGKWDKIH